jgi:hypothetical protein
MRTYMTGGCTMATTGELRAIIADLELVDVGEAASYLGENALDEDTDPDMTALSLASCLSYIASNDKNSL